MTTPKMHLRRGGCQRARYALSAQMTEKHTEVTCRTCRRLIRSRGLKERSDFPDAPTFTVHEIARYRGSRVIGCSCPVCGAKLLHGGGFNVGAGDGHRCAHCDCWEHGYYIREERSDEAERLAADDVLNIHPREDYWKILPMLPRVLSSRMGSRTHYGDPVKKITQTRERPDD